MPDSSFLPMQTWKAAVMAQILRLPQSRWETWMALLAPSFSHNQTLQSFGKWTKKLTCLFLSVSHKQNYFSSMEASKGILVLRNYSVCDPINDNNQLPIFLPVCYRMVPLGRPAIGSVCIISYNFMRICNLIRSLIFQKPPWLV